MIRRAMTLLWINQYLRTTYSDPSTSRRPCRPHTRPSRRPNWPDRRHLFWYPISRYDLIAGADTARRKRSVIKPLHDGTSGLILYKNRMTATCHEPFIGLSIVLYRFVTSSELCRWFFFSSEAYESRSEEVATAARLQRRVTTSERTTVIRWRALTRRRLFAEHSRLCVRDIVDLSPIMKNTKYRLISSTLISYEVSRFLW